MPITKIPSKTIVPTYLSADDPGRDSFNRLRVSNPQTLFETKFLYDKQTIFWDEAISGTGTATHITNGSYVELAVNASAGDRVVRQTKEYFAYQPGKALKHGEPVLTLNGWKPIEKIKVGDYVYDGLGKKTKVIGVYPQGIRKIYRITFDDGTHVDADKDHLWKTIIREGKRKGEIKVLTTEEMIKKGGNNPKGFKRWRIPKSPILDIENFKTDIDPYTIGAILGDAHITKKGGVVFTTADEEILKHIKCKKITKRKSKYAYGISGLNKYFVKNNLNGKTSENKFIPKEYLFNSKEVRLSTLQGLMDTDGCVDKDEGCCEYNSSSKQLAEDVAFLVRSLGGQAKIRRKKSYYLKNNDKIKCKDSYRVRVIINTCPFRLERKAFYWKPRTRISFDRYIHSIEYLEDNEATCISVDSSDHTFLTRNNIVTHNSFAILFTGVMEVSGGAAGVTSRIGIFDDDADKTVDSGGDGLFFELDGTTMKIVERTFTSGSQIDTAVEQSNWNIDPMDGSGKSGINLNFDETQIFIIDIEWLGVGSVRYGFVVDGLIYYCHRTPHANVGFQLPYMRTATLPIRYEISTDGTSAGEMRQICTSVLSEGGYSPVGPVYSASRDITTKTIGNTLVPIISIRPNTTYSRTTLVPIAINVTSITQDTIHWAVYHNTTLTGASWVNVTDSFAQYDISSTAFSGGRRIFSGYLAEGGAGSGSQITIPIVSTLKARANIAGTPEIISVIAQNLSGSADVIASVTWQEIY